MSEQNILLAVYLPHQKDMLKVAEDQLGSILHFRNVKNDGCIELWRTANGASVLPVVKSLKKRSLKTEEKMEL